MADIRHIDTILIDDLFEMGGGYVLNFSDRTFASFFAEELKLYIDNPVYAKNVTCWSIFGLVDTLGQWCTKEEISINSMSRSNGSNQSAVGGHSPGKSYAILRRSKTNLNR